MTLQRETIIQRLIRSSSNQTSEQLITNSHELEGLIERTVLPRNILLTNENNQQLSFEVASGRVLSIDNKVLMNVQYLEALDRFCAQALPAKANVSRADLAALDHQGFAWTRGDASPCTENTFWLHLKEAAKCYIEIKNTEITDRFGPDDDLAFLSRFTSDASRTDNAPQCAIFSTSSSKRQSLIVGNANSDGMVALIPSSAVVEVTKAWQKSI